MNALREECQQLRDELIALRREFHRDPELGLHEYHTAARIERELDRCGIPHERVGETAVVGHLTGNGNGSGLVVLRAVCAQNLCRAKKTRRVRVVAAGVHRARRLRAVGHVVRLLNG